jgi:hypothetical protein
LPFTVNAVDSEFAGKIFFCNFITRLESTKKKENVNSSNFIKEGFLKGLTLAITQGIDPEYNAETEN